MTDNAQRTRADQHAIIREAIADTTPGYQAQLDAALSIYRDIEEAGWKLHIERMASTLTAYAYRNPDGACADRLVTPVVVIDLARPDINPVYQALTIILAAVRGVIFAPHPAGTVPGLMFAVSRDGGKTCVASRANVFDAMDYCALQNINGGDYAVVVVKVK